MFGAPAEDRVAGLVELGMTPEVAKACAEAGGPEMGACILALYRSAVQPALVEWGKELEQAERRPALVIAASADPFVGGVEAARRSAERFGARFAVLEGLGHWWMLQDPVGSAAVLNEFHAGLTG
jgi:pimeloyl-ACP methyl ester carboxylesterase